MEVSLDQLRGNDSYKYIGVPVSVTLVTDEVLKGELYCTDLQRGQTMVLKSEGPEDTSLFIVRATSVKKLIFHGKLNESINDIPRIQYNDLALFKQLTNRN